jgi:hypothetical protein
LLTDADRLVKIFLIEKRDGDVWFDFVSRTLRRGEVQYYRVKDAVSGTWLFKVSIDKEFGKTLVKVSMSPPGVVYPQLEGDTMVFQKSLLEGYMYDTISISYVEENGSVRKKNVGTAEELPKWITSGMVENYEKATGKKPTYGRGLVTVVREDDYKAMIKFFLMEKAWPLGKIPTEIERRKKAEAKRAPIPPERRNVLRTIAKLEMAEDEGIYRALDREFGMKRDEAERILAEMKKEKKIIHPKPGYTKRAR